MKAFDEIVEVFRSSREPSLLVAAGGEPGSPGHPGRMLWENLEGDSTPNLRLSTGFSGVPIADVPSSRSVKEAAREIAAGMVGDLNAPMSNTGHKFTVHWAEISIWATPETVADLVAQCFFDDFCPFTEAGLDRFEEIGAAKFYHHLLKAPGGIFLRHGFQVATSEHCSVQLTGESFDVHGMGPLGRFLAMIEEQGLRWHVTRIDHAFDGVGFTPRDVYRHLVRDNVRSLAERKTIRWFETPCGEDAGTTCYFGNRKRDLVRVYDRRATGTRLEHECRGRRANYIGFMLAHTPVHQWQRVALGNLRDFMDLVRRKTSKNVSRCKLVGFWRDFVQTCARADVRLSDNLGALKKAAFQCVERVKVVAKSVRRRVGKLFLAMGEETFLKMVKRDVQLLHPADVAQAAEWRLVVDLYCETWCLTPADVFAKFIVSPASSSSV